MRINVTKNFLKKKQACSDFFEYWVKTKKPNLFEFINQCKKNNHLDWANWLIVRCMDSCLC